MVDVIAYLPKNRRERTRVAIDQFEGLNLIDIRAAVQLSECSDCWSPTKKGISLRIEQLPDLIAALQQAEMTARAKGLIGGDA